MNRESLVGIYKLLVCRTQKFICQLVYMHRLQKMIFFKVLNIKSILEFANYSRGSTDLETLVFFDSFPPFSLKLVIIFIVFILLFTVKCTNIWLTRDSALIYSKVKEQK